jgi:hypothetical protein
MKSSLLKAKTKTETAEIAATAEKNLLPGGLCDLGR